MRGKKYMGGEGGGKEMCRSRTTEEREKKGRKGEKGEF